MAIEKMGENYYEKTTLKDGTIKMHRLSVEELPWTPKERPDTPDDIVRISYRCRGCEKAFHQNIPPKKGDANMTEVARHFMYCEGGVDYRYLKRWEFED